MTTTNQTHSPDSHFNHIMMGRFVSESSRRNRLVERLIASVILLNCMDVLTTYLAIDWGLAKEQNVLAAYVFSITGLVPGLLAMKLLAISLLLFGYWFYQKYNLRWFQISYTINLYFGLALYTGVVVSNTLVILTRI